MIVLPLIAVGFFFHILGAAFRVWTAAFLFAWFAIPVFAFCLRFESVLTCFTLIGLQRIRGTLLLLVAAASMCAFANLSALVDQFGERYVKGHRSGSVHFTDDGEEYYKEHWKADNRSGSWAMNSFGVVLLAAIFGLPAITVRACDDAVWNKEREGEARNHAQNDPLNPDT
jgi:hypothetical protein